MKSLASSDSLGAMMSLCPNSTDGDDQVNNNTMYRREFQTMMDGLDEEGCCVDESGSGREKKRRLGVDQVKALEKNFEVENKLEPERKLKLAQELGLQPRQVAVWFQNRRARWKTKQLERDYGVLKNNYDGLKIGYEKLQRDNEALLREIKELKSKLSDDRNGEDSAKEEEEVILSDTEEKANLGTPPVNNFLEEMETEDFREDHQHAFLCGSSILVYDFKDGSSDSDSSAILNEDNKNNEDSPINTNAAAAAIQHIASMNTNIQFLSPSWSSSSSKKSAGFNNGDHNGQYQKVYDQFVKIEEHNFFGHEESCTNLFSEDQAPSLPWYCSEEWS